MELKIGMKQKLHLKAPGNWINDPNGFIYYKGRYHLFYQYFPYEPRWGTMHWGHAVSDDLLTWEHEGIALFPSKYADQNGCFSGSAVEADGRMHLFYTGVHFHETDPEDIHVCLNDRFESAQLTICSEDGFHFDNTKGKKVIIPPLEDPEIGDRTHTRDPKVWRGKDAWYMVLGSLSKERKGKLLIYRSENLTDWEYKNSVTKEDGFGWMWECPDYFEVDHEKVLIFSPMGILKEKGAYENQAICTLVDFDEESCRMTIPDTYQFLDYGEDLYAPQSTVDKDGNRVVAAWLRMPKPVEGKWIGMFSLPRVVEVCKGHIYFRPHPEVKKAYSQKIDAVTKAHEGGYRISMDLQEQETIDVGGYKVFRKNGCIHTDRSEVFGDCKDYKVQFATPELKDGCHVDIYVDDNLVEVFVNDGEYVISNAVYGLKKELQTDSKEKPEIYTVE